MPKQANLFNVVIVGASAMGMTLGYHLSLAGAKITFLVRPARASELSGPQVLYSYDDNSLKTLSEFEVITAPDAVSVRASDYVVVTLDGSATRSPEGAALIGALGRTIADTEAMMIGGGVGVGLRDHYLAVTGLPSHRVMMAVLGSLAYQVDRVRLPLHPPTDPALLARAAVAYRHYSKNGLIVEGRFADAAKQFASLYDRNSVVRCSVLERHLYDLSTMVPFPIYAGSELLGWRPTSEMAEDKAVWRLTADAVREIARLGRNGWRGQLTALLLTDGMVARLWGTIDRDALPLDHPKFNAFHHGAKVAAQDLAIMRACVEAGHAEGKPMTALRELLRRLAHGQTESA